MESSSSHNEPVLPAATPAGIPHLYFTDVVQDVSTDFSFTSYSNKNTLFITQTGRIGSLFLVERDSVMREREDTYSVNTLLGKRADTDPELFFARTLGELFIKQFGGNPVLIGIQLKSPSPQLLKALIARLRQEEWLQSTTELQS